MRPAVRATGWALGGLATLAAWAALWLFASARVGQALRVLADIPWPWALAAAGAAAAFYALDALRFRWLVAPLGHTLGLGRGVALTCASYAVSNLTPLDGLHLPTVVHLLEEDGLEAGRATDATVTKSAWTVAWLLALALASLGSSAAPAPVRLGARLWFGPQAALLLGALWGRRRLRWAIAARWVRMERGAQVGFQLATAGFLGAYGLLVFTLVRAVGLEATLPGALAAAWGGLLVAYVAPVPKPMGVAELATAYLLAPALPPEALAVGLGARLLGSYGAMPAGAVVLLRSLWIDGAARWRARVWA